MTYDNLSRLSSGRVSAGPWNTLILGWTYDSFGNRQTQTVYGNPPGFVPQSQSLHYVNNQVVGYMYDPSQNGELLYDNINRYVYDAEGRVCAVATSNGMTTAYQQYVYDAEGRRVAKGTINTLACTSNPLANGFTLSNNYILGLSGEQISELDGSGNFLRTNVYGSSRLLATYANGSTQFAFTDWLGTKRVVANPDGTVAETCASLPFGDELICSGANASAHHFAGQLHDQETGNDYFSARYYSNKTGRFVSPDQSNLSVDWWLPQTWNRYGYAINNPLNVLDRNGLWPTYVHNNIIDESFPGLSRNDLDNLKEASVVMDSGVGQQLPENSYMHGISDGGGTVFWGGGNQQHDATRQIIISMDKFNQLRHTRQTGLRKDTRAFLL